VGNVHHMTHAVAVELERAAQTVDKYVSAQVAEMLRQIDRRPARVKRHFGRVLWLKFLDRARQRIENVEWFHECESQVYRAPATSNKAGTGEEQITNLM